MPRTSSTGRTGRGADFPEEGNEAEGAGGKRTITVNRLRAGLGQISPGPSRGRLHGTARLIDGLGARGARKGIKQGTWRPKLYADRSGRRA
jgi:hypothetical protein